MIEWLKRCWKVVAMIPIIAATLGGIMVLPTKIATPADLKQLEAKTDAKLDKAKAETNAAMQAIVGQMILKGDLDRLNQINDSLMKAKIQQRQLPKGGAMQKDIAEDIETLKADKEKLQQKIEKR